MARSIQLFISSSPELGPEREWLGQAVAELPVSTGWKIKHTPRSGEDVREALAFIEQCDVFLIVLGSDYAAPMGLEWEQALRTSRPLLACRKYGLHSPAAQRLLRQSNIVWTEFQSHQELKDWVSQALATFLLDQGERFGLQLVDIERLLAEKKKTQDKQPAEPDRRHGAGRSGVILSRDI